jgi:hypothetical protein
MFYRTLEIGSLSCLKIFKKLEEVSVTNALAYRFAVWIVAVKYFIGLFK